ncbi:MAG: alpha,alpha-phosphotrehalase [Clostridiaceae bacterium]|nr:alpha,alpha-phosphotrehalase [Clostridiaceae bacterium]
MLNFKDKVVYQIYVKSFYDSNGDGLGDLRGIIEKLGYLQALGVDYLWLTPFFRSPLNDNGYDVADYLSIDPVFGSMGDVETLIAETKERGMKLMFDMVFNHTSTGHEWFQKALAGDPYYLNFYIFRDGTPDTPPTNWQSKFGGSAWEYVPRLGKWYLHLFDKTQADLNWDNPAVREAVADVLRFWKAKGVEGFRFDVVNLISKPAQFEDDDVWDGRRFYTDGPHVHEYLKEMVAAAGIGDMVTVGEMSSTSLDNCIRYTTENELSMVFGFHHLKVDYKNGDKWELQPVDYGAFKRLFADWQIGMQQAGGWNALFLCNHDQPRAVSRFGDDKRYWKESAKMLAACIHMMRGTPYIFQGEELGITNAGYTDISQYRDIESLNYYRIMLESGKTKEEALETLRQRSRDNGRTPMQWDGSPNAGFTDGTPWIQLPENYRTINVEAELQDPDSILHFYKALIRLRKENPLISDGKIEFLYPDETRLLAYRRFLRDDSLWVFNNLSGKELPLPSVRWSDGCERLLGNYPEVYAPGGQLLLRPYETIACRLTDWG